jgi:hypothetical protein
VRSHDLYYCGVRRKEKPRLSRIRITVKFPINNLVRNLVEKSRSDDYIFLYSRYSSLENFMTLYNKAHLDNFREERRGSRNMFFSSFVAFYNYIYSDI